MQKKISILKHISNEFKFNYILFLLLITLIIFIYSTYAWFSATFNVEITDFNMRAETDTGLSISLDGNEWSDSVSISEKTIIDDLKNSYSNNTNQWSETINTVSTVGLLNDIDDKFTFFQNKHSKVNYLNKGKVTLIKLDESKSNNNSAVIAFDLFFKNNSGSPYNDNLYIKSDSYIRSLDNNVALNSIRFGMVFMDTIDLDANVFSIQNITCNPTCSSFIYEPNSMLHNEDSVKILKKHNVSVENNKSYPTYAVTKEAENIPIWSGIRDSDVTFNEDVFKIQNTITDFSNPIFSIPNGITKSRVYIWIEGQDIDVLEYFSEGYDVSIKILFEKDLAGYN